MTILESFKTIWPWLVGTPIILWIGFFFAKEYRRNKSLRLIDENNNLSLKLAQVNDQLQYLDEILKNWGRSNITVSSVLVHLNDLANLLLQLKGVDVITSISDIKVLIDQVNSDVKLSQPANTTITSHLPALLEKIKSEINAIEKRA